MWYVGVFEDTSSPQDGDDADGSGGEQGKKGPLSAFRKIGGAMGNQETSKNVSVYGKHRLGKIWKVLRKTVRELYMVRKNI